MFHILIYILFAIVIGYFANKLYFRGKMCRSINRLDGKTVIITGATSGVGLATATELAKRGAIVIIAGRRELCTHALVEAIKLEANNPNIKFHELDLSNLNSVRDFSEKIKSQISHLDILINNAGVMACPYSKTVDGYEMQFAVNHLGHFLLTNLLLDLLKKNRTSRIITVSSVAHLIGQMNWNDFNSEQNYHFFSAYCQSKLANILFTVELAKRLKGTGVTAVALNPGSVRTNILRHTKSSICWLVPYIISIAYPIYWAFSKSPFEGAQTTVYCAVDENIPKLSGRYFSDCKPATTSKLASDSNAAEKLWNLSTKMVGLDVL